jgi:hypothetical protein
MEKLNSAQKQKLAEQIKTLDTKGEIVVVTPGADFKGGSITYNKDIGLILGEGSYRLTDEEYVRARLVVRLVKKLG